MCFQPKMKVPKVEAQAIVPPPVPLLEDPAGVKFGGDDDAYENPEGKEQGRIDLEEDAKKEKDKEAEKNKKPTRPTTNVATNRRARSIGRAVGGFTK